MRKSNTPDASVELVLHSAFGVVLLVVWVVAVSLVR